MVTVKRHFVRNLRESGRRQSGLALISRPKESGHGQLLLATSLPKPFQISGHGQLGQATSSKPLNSRSKKKWPRPAGAGHFLPATQDSLQIRGHGQLRRATSAKRPQSRSTQVDTATWSWSLPSSCPKAVPTKEATTK